MHNLRTLSVSFAEPIHGRELECFRGAIIEKVGINRELYHNHNNQSGAKSAYHYRYPKIQYKLWRKRPTIVFIDDAISEASHFFRQSVWDLTIAGRPYEVKVDQLKARELQIGLGDKPKEYRIRRWLALNSKNFRTYQELPTLRAKISKLEQLLGNNILSLASGLGYRFPERFKVEIIDLMDKYPVHYKGVQLLAFDLSFRTSVVLPFGLALGKGASLGYGNTSIIVPTGEVIAEASPMQVL